MACVDLLGAGAVEQLRRGQAPLAPAVRAGRAGEGLARRPAARAGPGSTTVGPERASPTPAGPSASAAGPHRRRRRSGRRLVAGLRRGPWAARHRRHVQRVEGLGALAERRLGIADVEQRLQEAGDPADGDAQRRTDGGGGPPVGGTDRRLGEHQEAGGAEPHQDGRGAERAGHALERVGGQRAEAPPARPRSATGSPPWLNSSRWSRPVTAISSPTTPTSVRSGVRSPSRPPNSSNPASRKTGGATKRTRPTMVARPTSTHSPGAPARPRYEPSRATTPSARKPTPARSERWWRTSSFASAPRAGRRAGLRFGPRGRGRRGGRSGGRRRTGWRPLPPLVVVAVRVAVLVGTAAPTVTAATSATGARHRAGRQPRWPSGSRVRPRGRPGRSSACAGCAR